MLSSNRHVSLQSGFTLIESLVVIVVLGITGVYAVMKSVSPADLTLPSQVYKLASDLRHTQMLAATSSRVLCFRTGGAGGNSYHVTEGLACPASPVIADPAIGASFSVVLQKGVVFGSGVPTSLVFDSLGRPVNSSGVPLSTSPAASYPLSSGSATKTVAVEGISGRVYLP
jgi:prepilin-type N-terminal cleavage/methylation domain-containing protein